MPKQLQIDPGARFGFLTVVREAERHRTSGGVSKRVFLVKCDCGAEKQVAISSLVEGKTVSCGCFHKRNAREKLSKACVTHGMSRSSLHMIWSAMKARCLNPANKRYARYGGRGIKVCDLWANDFSAFARDVGPKPDGMTLDRIDNNGNYEPGNVRWATYKEQARKTRRTFLVEYKGKEMSLAEASELSGINYGSLRTSLQVGRGCANREGITRV